MPQGASTGYEGRYVIKGKPKQTSPEYAMGVPVQGQQEWSSYSRWLASDAEKLYPVISCCACSSFLGGP